MLSLPDRVGRIIVVIGGWARFYTFGSLGQIWAHGHWW